MFGRRRDTAKISDRSPVFHVRFIGCTETHLANGRGCSYAPVQRLWDNAPVEKYLRKVSVEIHTVGITLKDEDRRDDVDVSRTFPIENVSFCNADRAVNDRIFSWICRNDPDRRLDCYAVLCSSAQKAQTMAVVMSRAFHIAYKDWKAHNRGFREAFTSGPSKSPSPSGSVVSAYGTAAATTNTTSSATTGTTCALPAATSSVDVPTAQSYADVSTSFAATTTNTSSADAVKTSAADDDDGDDATRYAAVSPVSPSTQTIAAVSARPTHYLSTSQTDAFFNQSSATTSNNSSNRYSDPLYEEITHVTG